MTHNLGNHRMKVLLDLMEDDQILEEIKGMDLIGFNPNKLFSDQGITNQEWYDRLVYEAVTRKIK